jgi:hypothetical protein
LKIEAFLMSTPRTIRMIRVRRAAAISVAAVAVVLGPTACDSASAGHSGGYGAGHSQHGTEVVTVANQERADEDGDARNGRDREGDGQESDGRESDGGDQNLAEAEENDAAGPEESENPGDGQAPEAAAAEVQENNGLEVLGRTCENSDLPPHSGFQDGNRCSDTAFGEVGEADKNPSLLIVDFPRDPVKVGETFEIKVATKNLIRDRFLGAADGGYYLESSFLDDETGLQRGHFHTACRMVDGEPPSPGETPKFFLATQDNGGGEDPDVVTIVVEGGIDEAGEVQCSSWAGDGSHRIPMMQRANQTPAFDSVRITVE